MWRKAVCIFLLLLLFVPSAAFSEAQDTPDPQEDGFEASEGGSSGMPTGMPGLSSENFSADDPREMCNSQGHKTTVMESRP